MRGMLPQLGPSLPSKHGMCQTKLHAHTEAQPTEQGPPLRQQQLSYQAPCVLASGGAAEGQVLECRNLPELAQWRFHADK